MRFLAFLLLSGFVATCSGQGETDAETWQAIGELNEAYVTAFNARDSTRIAKCFTAESEFTLLTGDTIRGLPKIVAAHKAFFHNNPNAKISGKQLSRRLIRPEVSIATGEWKVENGPAEYPAAGLWSTVVAKRDGAWQYEAMRLMIAAKPQ